ncbi:putative uncharacterized protein DDB_G0282129 isoform X2 [Drosophila willistoni]|uniref:putative uncharacterized protein DDB_G0282129 isoform X2 n=1 Tax=Drosophila willistoni TaxID=7260 RepID=UPI000C26D3E6|nr:putative uncharacterized protein DDB_G0282129 isoform X2 [Drosophila willistoni]
MDEKDIGDGSLPLDQTESIPSGSPQTPPHKLLTSSALNSWTILPDEKIELLLDNSNEDSGSVARREEEQRLNQEQHDEKHANDRCMRPLDEVQLVGAGAADDISDGISIISDCESTERISPHPFLSDHLNELLHFNDLSTPIVLTTSSSSQAPDQQPEENQLKQRRHENAPNEDDDGESLSNNDKNLMVRQQTSSALSGYQRLPNLVQSGLTAVFYVGVTLAILAFIGKLRHPEWENGNGESGKSMSNLERRLEDLELQNNLMRAEIDLISKQLQYLSSDQGPTQQQQQQQQGRKAKTFKAWSGNGDAGQPVDITKEDLKRPFKCQDGNYVEFAAMCLESKKTTAEHAESLVDEIGNVVNNVLQQSQTFQRFEKVTDRLAASTNVDGNANNGDEIGSDFSKKQQQQRQKNINKYSSESPQTAQSGSHHQHQHSREEQQSKFYKKQRYAANSKENDSKERYKKKFYKEHDDSDEHRSQQRGKKPRRMSKEDDDDDDDDDDNNNNSGSGEWHQQMMQHREQSRKRNQRNNNNNWYIERGDSREQKRSGETKR